MTITTDAQPGVHPLTVRGGAHYFATGSVLCWIGVIALYAFLPLLIVDVAWALIAAGGGTLLYIVGHALRGRAWWYVPWNHQNNAIAPTWYFVADLALGVLFTTAVLLVAATIAPGVLVGATALGAGAAGYYAGRLARYSRSANPTRQRRLLASTAVMTLVAAASIAVVSAQGPASFDFLLYLNIVAAILAAAIDWGVSTFRS